jgi:methylenetetrahydrofolate--tRNA-(uracil-5-)-methyltransferase
MNTNYGLFPPLAQPTRDKEKKRQLIAERAREDFERWMTQYALS